jgi:hypothetical protein
LALPYTGVEVTTAMLACVESEHLKLQIAKGKHSDPGSWILWDTDMQGIMFHMPMPYFKIYRLAFKVR